MCGRPGLSRVRWGWGWWSWPWTVETRAARRKRKVVRSNLKLGNGENCEPWHITKGWYALEGGFGGSEVDVSTGADLVEVATGGIGIDTALLCRGRNTCASFMSRPYLMMPSSPGAAVGAGRAEAKRKRVSATAQRAGTFIGCGKIDDEKQGRRPAAVVSKAAGRSNSNARSGASERGREQLP